MADEKDIEVIYSKINKLSNEVAEMKATRPFLLQMIEQNIASNEKLAETLHQVQITMVTLNEKIDTQSKALETLRDDFTEGYNKNNKRLLELDGKIEMIEEKGKFDVQMYIKQNWPWILILIGLGINFASQFVKFR